MPVEFVRKYGWYKLTGYISNRNLLSMCRWSAVQMDECELNGDHEKVTGWATG